MHWYHVEARPYGGGPCYSIAHIDRPMAAQLAAEFGHGDASALDTIAVGSWWHIGVPRKGLLTFTRTR